jgi:adenosylmethionine-8-amino-7-oxononanoate aminotransferase
MIADEVMCETGRCGTWRRSPMTSAGHLDRRQGLGGGFLPLGATVYHQRAEPSTVSMAAC